MKKYIIYTFLLLSSICKAQQSTADCSTFKSDATIQELQWFPDAKFGIFIHMTLQNVPMTDKESYDYKRNPDVARQIAYRLNLSKYDARQQARLFKSWGAKYVVLTAKHHVGFALFDGPSDFNIMNSSNVKRDIVREYINALREEGLKVGIYFSLPDWTHKDYATIVDEYQPKEKRIKTRAYAVENDTIRWNHFVEDMHKQVEFLCTNYGKIDLMWFDGDWERNAEKWKSKELACMIHRLQPGCVINNRLRHIDLGHYITSENVLPLVGKDRWWEFCMTPGDNWDGVDANINIKPASELIRIFTDVIGMNGNALFNVAPTDNGAIPTKQVKTLNELGRWITDHAEAIYGTEGHFPIGLFNGPVTRKGKTLYLFAQDGPKNEIVLKGTQNNIKRISDLKTGKELKWRYSGGYKGWKEKGILYITIPQNCLEKYTTVIKVEFEDEDIQFRTPSGIPYKF